MGRRSDPRERAVAALRRGHRLDRPGLEREPDDRRIRIDADERAVSRARDPRREPVPAHGLDAAGGRIDSPHADLTVHEVVEQEDDVAALRPRVARSGREQEKREDRGGRGAELHRRLPPVRGGCAMSSLPAIVPERWSSAWIFR